MKKRGISILLALVTVISLVGCGNAKKSNNHKKTEGAIEKSNIEVNVLFQGETKLAKQLLLQVINNGSKTCSVEVSYPVLDKSGNKVKDVDGEESLTQEDELCAIAPNESEVLSFSLVKEYWGDDSTIDIKHPSIETGKPEGCTPLKNITFTDPVVDLDSEKWPDGMYGISNLSATNHTGKDIVDMDIRQFILFYNGDKCIGFAENFFLSDGMPFNTAEKNEKFTNKLLENGYQYTPVATALNKETWYPQEGSESVTFVDDAYCSNLSSTTTYKTYYGGYVKCDEVPQLEIYKKAIRSIK